MSAGAQPPGTTPVWDLPTRIFHWALVIGITSAWISYEFAEALGDELMVWHRTNGLCILTLVLWRLMWGIFGSSTARFSTFVRGPSTVITYLQGLLRPGGAHYLGHNPAGALMILALLIMVIATGTLGLFAMADNELTGGPFYETVSEATSEWATELHETFFNLLLGLIVLHISANVLYGIVKKDPLIAAMVTGRKPVADYVDAPAAEIAPSAILRALALLLVAALIVFGGLNALGGEMPL